MTATAFAEDRFTVSEQCRRASCLEAVESRVERWSRLILEWPHLRTVTSPRLLVVARSRQNETPLNTN